jgi:GH24 family phage-related lysozyme (muramidase)
VHISERGIRLIESFEGFSASRYDDGTGVMTIGYGTTAADIDPLPTYCTRAQAEGWLRQKLTSKYEPAVNGLGVPLNQNQFDALVSLVYNCGPGAMQWQIGLDLRARRYTAAANDSMRYVYAGGRVLQGLVNRRRAERALFLTAPAPTPGPDPYAIFPRGKLPGISIDERDTVVHVDGALQHPGRYRGFLKGTLRPRLVACRDRCWRIAKYQPPDYRIARRTPAWNDTRHLGQRWQQLNNRIKAIDRIP